MQESCIVKDQKVVTGGGGLLLALDWDRGADYLKAEDTVQTLQKKVAGELVAWDADAVTPYHYLISIWRYFRSTKKVGSKWPKL